MNGISISGKIIGLFLFAIIVFIFNFTAQKLHFFTSSYQDDSNNICIKDVIFTFLIYLFVNFLLLSIFINVFSLVTDVTLPYVSSLIIFFFYLLSVLILLLYYHKKPPQKPSPFTLSNNIISGMIACILIYPTALFTSQILDTINMLLFHITEPSKQSIVDYLQKTMQSPLAFFLTIVTIVVIAPISEEILFRGYLQTWLKKLFGKKIGILFASFIFALFHFSYPQGYGNITIIGSLFVVAIYFGILYERQKSLISPIIAHMIFNTISTINILLSKDL